MNTNMPLIVELFLMRRIVLVGTVEFANIGLRVCDSEEVKDIKARSFIYLNDSYILKEVI